MLFNKNFNKKNHSLLPIILLLIILNINVCQKLSEDILGGWSEKIITEETPDFTKNLEEVENYLKSEGYDLDDTNILPIGYFKQIVNGVNYRIICAVKKKSDDSPTIFDIFTHKSNNEIKMISSKNPDYSSTELSEKAINQMKNAILKYYFKDLYTITNLEIQYEYHNLAGLFNYAIYDVHVELSKRNKNENENANKRVIIIYRNDKTFTVEKELEIEE